MARKRTKTTDTHTQISLTPRNEVWRLLKMHAAAMDYVSPQSLVEDILEQWLLVHPIKEEALNIEQQIKPTNEGVD